MITTKNILGYTYKPKNDIISSSKTGATFLFKHQCSEKCQHFLQPHKSNDNKYVMNRITFHPDVITDELNHNMDDLYRFIRSLKSKFLVKIVSFFRSYENYYLVSVYCNQRNPLNISMKSSSWEYKLLTKLYRIIKSFNKMIDGFTSIQQAAQRIIKASYIFENDGKVKFSSKIFLINSFNASNYRFYLSPKILKNFHNDYNFKDDSWSFGIMIYNLIFDDNPWEGENTESLLENINRNKELRFPKKECSLEMKELLTKLLKIDKDERIALVDVLNLDIFINFKKKIQKED